MRNLKINKLIFFIFVLLSTTNLYSQNYEDLMEIIEEQQSELTKQDKEIAELEKDKEKNEEEIEKLKKENIDLKDLVKYQQDEVIRKFGFKTTGIVNGKEKPLGILKNEKQKAKDLETITVKLSGHRSDSRTLRMELFYAGNYLEKTEHSDTKHFNKGSVIFTLNVNKSLKKGSYEIKIYDNENEIAKKVILLK